MDSQSFKTTTRIILITCIIYLSSVSILFSQQTPFGDGSAVIPGIIEAEDFDNGGEGISYHDSDAGNNGGAYRDTDVDIEDCSEGGFNVGWTEGNEWIEYTVDVDQEGIFIFGVRVASGINGGNFHLELDGAAITGSQQIAGTGGWQNWTTHPISDIFLPEGVHVLRLVFESSGLNVNYIEISSKTVAIQSIIQACEDMIKDLNGDVVLSGAEKEQYLNVIKTNISGYKKVFEKITLNA